MATQPIKSGQTGVMTGDSITAGVPPPNGWFLPAFVSIDAELAQPFTARATGGRSTATGGTAVAADVVPLTLVNTGIGGNKAADIAADIPGRITQYNPDFLVLEVGVNDATAATSLVAFRASIDAIFTGTLAARPACKLWAMSIFVWHEQWSSTPLPGPNWNNAFDPPPPFTYTPSIAEYNAQLQASVESFGGIFVETRTETLAYEAANNLPEPGAPVGPLTLDGLHPNALGKGIMCDQFLLTVQVVP